MSSPKLPAAVSESPRHTYNHSPSRFGGPEYRNSIPIPRNVSQRRRSPTSQRYQAFEDARAEFRSYRREYERTTVDGQRFVLEKPLTVQLEAMGVMEQMRDSANGVIAPKSIPSILRGDLPQYTKVFYILVEIGCPRLFRVFRDHNMGDDQLPLSRARLEDPTLPQNEEAASCYANFLIEQVAWCPISFSPDMSLSQHNRIEPFYHRDPIRPKRENRPLPPNNASLFEVHIPAELLHDDICRMLDNQGACIARDTASETRGGGMPSGNAGKHYRVALKRFPSNKKGAFERERSAFRTLRGREGIIQYIASYQTSNDEQETYYNILLEYAELDLYEVIRNEAPPVSPDEIKSFWEAMLEMCRSLEAIRTVVIEDAQFHVWHCDIKPENILRAGGRFKLADLGEACIRRSDPEEQPQAIITGGTMTYAAPEKAAYLDGRVARPPWVNQNSDVWSLGAVLSNAATYVVLGEQGVVKYDRVRRRAIKLAVGKKGDGFHDGNKVLEAVKLWHEYLCNCSRRHDNFTQVILDLINKHMLIDSRDRYNSTETADHLEAILRNSPSEERRVPSLIDTMLQEIENDAESFRERSMNSSVASLATISPEDNADAADEVPPSKHDLLNQQILPTVPQGA